MRMTQVLSRGKQAAEVVMRVGVAGMLLIGPTAVASAAELKQQTVQAWDGYVRRANARMQERLQGSEPFLWVDEQPDRRRAVQSGEVLTVPMTAHTPTRVPNGLIHDWLGAAFLPGTTLDDVTTVLRDYGRYTEYYGPTVVDANGVQKDEGQDRFSLVLMNHSFFLKSALSGDYHSSYFRVGAKRQYSVSQTTDVREIEDYGEPDARPLPSGRGSDYIWSLYSISRLEERDGGVYVEVEAIALSRDIPLSLRWLVDPIVRRVSRSALLTSLRQTREAVATKVATTRGEPRVPGSPVPCNAMTECGGITASKSFR